MEIDNTTLMLMIKLRGFYFSMVDGMFYTFARVDGWNLLFYYVTHGEFVFIIIHALIWKAIIWKTTKSSTMKLNSLGIDNHKLIMGQI